MLPCVAAGNIAVYGKLVEAIEGGLRQMLTSMAQ